MTATIVLKSYILTFDGLVFECFQGSKGNRIHVGQIEEIKILTNKKGNHKLGIETEGGFPWIEFKQSDFEKMSELVAEIQNAASEFKRAHSNQG
jgi:hypothetical protein